MTRSLDCLFNPTSVAILGASGDKTRIGGRPVRYLIESGFKGRIFPVNPGRPEIQGLKAYPTVDAIDEPVDCAVIALSSVDAIQAARSCAARGVKQLVVFSAGFAELGEEGQARQAELVKLARDSGMRVLGPNCLGAYSVHSGAFLTFSGVFDDVVGTKGRFGLVSQSGGYAGEVLKHAGRRGVAFGTWITTGNEADIEFGEILTSMAENPDVDAIVGYVEGIRSRDTFLQGLEIAQRKRKPVILLKVGRTQEGAEAAASHTASLAGADDVYDAIFREYGVFRARTTEDMLDVAYAVKRGIFPENRRLAILTNSGGIGIQAADFASDETLQVPPVPDDVRARISAMLPNASTRNPVDTTGQVANEPASFGSTLSAILNTGLYSSAYVCIGLIGGLPFLAKPLVETFAKAAQENSGKLIAVSVTAPAPVVAEYEAAGMLTFDDPARAIRAIAALAGFREAWTRFSGKAVSPAPADTPLLEPGRSFSEVESKAILEKTGISGPMERLARDANEADAQAAVLGRKVAIKVVSPDILHKTDVGGVALGVDPSAVAQAVRAMAGRVAAAAPDARIEGYLVTPMLEGGIECLVGVHNDPLFGPVVMFGLGGVTVEIYKDVTMRLAPVTMDQAREMIASIKGARLLDGYRGRPAADVDALATAIVAVSGLAHRNADRIRTIEINPLLVMPKGQGAVALDAVIETNPLGRRGE